MANRKRWYEKLEHCPRQAHMDAGRGILLAFFMAFVAIGLLIGLAVLVG